VRTAAPPATGPRFVTRTDTVLDAYTSLEWQHFVSNVELTFDEAAGYCTQLSLGGHQDWRLPSVKQLASLLDVAHYPMLDPTAFAGTSTPLLDFLSATRYGARPTQSAWYVDFALANIGLLDVSQSGYVRCVRAP
jgi:hypothetical protein